MLPAFVRHLVMNALMSTTYLKPSVMGSSWNFYLVVFESLTLMSTTYLKPSVMGSSWNFYLIVFESLSK